MTKEEIIKGIEGMKKDKTVGDEKILKEVIEVCGNVRVDKIIGL